MSNIITVVAEDNIIQVANIGVQGPGGGGGGAVYSVFGRTGNVTAQTGDYDKTQVGLSNVDNTSDLSKPISTATQAALDDKLEDAPSDGNTYGRNNGAWSVVSGTGAVDSVFGRTGAVTAQSGDYTNAQVGLGNVPNVNCTNADNINDGATKAIISLTQETNFETAYAHSQLTSGNPHSVTKADVGLSNVPNTDCTDADNISNGLTNAIITLTQETNFETAYSHSQVVTGNPHSVTKSEVGLSNVPNTDCTDADNISDGLTNAIITLTQEGNFETAYSHSQVITGNPHNVLATQITDFDTEVSNNSSVTANTAKVTNATHSGDVTGDQALTIANDAVSYSKMQNVVQDNRILGNVSGAGSPVDELTAAEVRTMINVGDGADVAGDASSTDNAVPRFNGTSGKALQNSGVIVDDNDDVSGARNIQYEGTAYGNGNTLTDGATITPDLDDGDMMFVTLAGNRTLANPSNVKTYSTFQIKVKQDAIGSRTLVYGTSYKFPGGTAPILSTGANAVDLLTFSVFDSTTEILCVDQPNFS